VVRATARTTKHSTPHQPPLFATTARQPPLPRATPLLRHHCISRRHNHLLQAGGDVRYLRKQGQVCPCVRVFSSDEPVEAFSQSGPPDRDRELGRIAVLWGSARPWGAAARGGAAAKGFGDDIDSARFKNILF